jgi:hypothetical protein
MSEAYPGPEFRGSATADCGARGGLGAAIGLIVDRQQIVTEMSTAAP